jgi:hypothetical protein
MADRSLKLLSKNRPDDWSIVGCIRLSCLNFWTKVCLPEFFEITSRQSGQLRDGLFLNNKAPLGAGLACAYLVRTFSTARLAGAA